ncbi:unnamed protein product [Paramecium octaurelia]|uniref:CRAL-TRIO domain-containing protein n=1 Tax=Paramecium octaurelia TaxID=43137 RepID=A0A8S1SKG7_PAROT|nr:unnamed protein product [Paramecium octaurelia]
MIYEGITSIVHSEFYIKSGNGTSIQRNIFENVDYDDYEKQLIEEIKTKMKEKGLQVKLKRSILLKMLMAAQYNIEKAIINCQSHLNFLQEYQKQDCVNELKKGHLYVCGFDNQFRPVIVIRQYCDIKIMAYFLETVKRQLLIDYYVENWTVILDLDTDLPVIELDDLLYLQLHFYGNLNKILIVNGPDDIDDIVKQFTEKIKDLQVKIKIITEYQQILQYIPKEQLEIKYGGDFNNIELFWPILKRETHTGTNRLLKKNSHLSINSMGSSINKKPSFMKITVLEENGNPLLNQQVEVFEDQIESQQEEQQQQQNNFQQQQQQQQQQQEDFEEKSKSYQSSTTKKQDQQFIQIDDDEDDLIEMESENMEKRKGKKQITKKYGEATKTTTYSQKQTILEGEKEIPSSFSCCSRSCSVF